MFIDGLDEFDGQYDSVIKAITDLSDQRHVKICVSSRPLLAFERAFNGNPCLRLQDLTVHTIREYTNRQLSHLVPQHLSYNGSAQHRAERLLNMIVKRADGVFLWAVIATREVRDGLQGMVDLHELEKAIEVLPPELESLFMLVLRRIKPAFQRDAAKFLQIILLTYDVHDILTYDNHNLDLCRLHLISSQQESQDAPFVYQNVAMSELSEGCRTLRIRLLSHTAGLLELTPSGKCASRYCKREDWDPITFTRVNFIHRTVRDFLMNNNEAKSFLNHKGLNEAQVHLCIARGTLAHLAQHSEGDAVMLDRYWPHPMLDPFQNLLGHVSRAERLSGGAQSNFIQSLDYASLVRGYTITESPCGFFVPFQAFSKNEAGTLVDVVGMAAAAGMTIYVCEQLGLSASFAGYYSSLPDLEEYSASRAALANLSWKMLDQLPDSIQSGNTLSPCSVYRQALSKCLQWEEDLQVNMSPDEQAENHSLAESYMLCCCVPTVPISFDLVRILLRAGANPMVRVRMKKTSTIFNVGSSSFWESWLEFLLSMRYDFMKANGKSGGLLLQKAHLDRDLTLSDVFEVTKALLAHGADVDSPTMVAKSTDSTCFLKRRDLANQCFGFDLLLSASAMFILEECFSIEPGFREFAIAVSPLIKTPSRKIKYLDGPKKKGSSSYSQIDLASAEESKLWPLIEKWESTGHQKDRVALVTAMEQIWKVHHPDYIGRQCRRVKSSARYSNLMLSC